jgi:hypothetical protein
MTKYLLIAPSSWQLGARPSGTERPASDKQEIPLEISKIFIEYNSTANDLGFQVSLDGEDWKQLHIVNPNGRTIFEVEGRGPYKELG